MGQSDNWKNVRIPKDLIEQIDYRVANDHDFKRMGFLSTSKFATYVLQKELEKYIMYEHRVIIPSLEKQKSTIELIDTLDDKIILKDSKCGIIFIQVDNSKRLQCYQVSGDTHNNKWVDFCLKDKSLFEYLKNKGVKIIHIRE